MAMTDNAINTASFFVGGPFGADVLSVGGLAEPPAPPPPTARSENDAKSSALFSELPSALPISRRTDDKVKGLTLGAAIPTFASRCCTLASKRRNQRTTSNFNALVELEFDI